MRRLFFAPGLLAAFAVLIVLTATLAWADRTINGPLRAGPGLGGAGAGVNVQNTFVATQYGSCTWDDAHDVGPCIAAAIVAATATGGTVILPAGEFSLETPLVYSSRVKIEGAGWGSIDFCGTRLTWNGAASGVMVQAGDLGVNAAISGLGMKGVCLDGNGVAANGLVLINTQQGRWTDFFLRNFTGCALLMDSTANAGPAVNLIENFQINQNFVGAGNGLCFGEGTEHGDVHENEFIGGIVTASDGIAFDCKGADTNKFMRMRFQTTGAGRSAVFHAASTPDLKAWCRRNFFDSSVFIDATGDGILVESGVRASTGNQIYGFKRGDGEALPEIQEYVLSTTGDTHTSATLDGLASTAGVLVDMPVFGSGIQALTTVVSVDSPTAVTLSLPALNSATGVTVRFGAAADLFCLDTNNAFCGTPVSKAATYAPVRLETTTTAHQLTDNDCGVRYTNRGATNGTTQTFVLPPAIGAGCTVTFVRWPIAGTTVKVSASYPDTISGSGIDNGASSAGGFVSSNSRYATITLVDQALNGWSVTGALGPWVNDLGGLMAGSGNVWLVTLDASSGLVFTNLPTSTIMFNCAGIVPGTDGADLLLQVSADNGSSWKNANYAYTVTGSNTGGAATPAAATAGTSIQINAGSAIDASAANPITANIYLYNNNSTTANKNVSWSAAYNNNTPVFETVQGAGKYTGDQAAINAVRLVMSSGTFSSGSCASYGLVH